MIDMRTYQTDVLYVPNYTHRLSPAFMRFALLLRGFDFPRREQDEPFRYLELGFGKGHSLAVHAAANSGEYWGVDFLSGHCDAARSMTVPSGAACTILQQSFAATADMAESGALPFFDVIALHGVWSWVDAENHDHILRIIRSRLKSGGVVFVSYNAQPGWSILAPIRDLAQHMLKEASGQNVETRIQSVMDRLLAFSQSDGLFFKLNPLCGIYLAEMARKPPAFLAHDFFNPTWRPFSFRDVAHDLQSVQCDFAAPADLFNNTDAGLPAKAATTIADTVDPVLRETFRDFVINNQFRCDLFIRTPQKLSPEEFRGRLGAVAIRRTHPRQELPAEISCGFVTIPLAAERYGPLLDALNGNADVPVTIRDCAESLLQTDAGARSVAECLSVLREEGLVRVIADPARRGSAKTVGRLNRELCRQCLEGEGGPVLASSLYGEGYPVSDEEQVLLSCRPATSDTVEWAGNIVDQMIARGYGGDRASAAAQEARHVATFVRDKLPILESHGIVVR